MVEETANDTECRISSIHSRPPSVDEIFASTGATCVFAEGIIDVTNNKVVTKKVSAEICTIGSKWGF